MNPLLRLAIIERGECAVRALTAIGALNNAGDAQPVTTVLLHRDPDPQPWFGREADEAVFLGPATIAPDCDHVVTRLQSAHVDALWLGDWDGSRIELVEACERAGIGVLGPSSATLRLLADTEQLTVIARGAGFSDSLAAGSRARRVEIDVLADDHGTIWTLGGRDVSVRHGDHVLIAESPCAAIDTALGDRLRAAVVELVREIGYRGAGVVTVTHAADDFVLTNIDPVAAPAHAITEERTGASLIGLRVRVYRGEALAEIDLLEEGVAIDARLLAQPVDEPCDPDAPCRVALLSFPVGTGVRVDANRRVGDRIDPADPLLGVITAWGADRTVALARLRRALERTAVVVQGGATNRSLLLTLLAHADLRNDDVDLEWFERVHPDEITTSPDPIALLVAAVEAYEADRKLGHGVFFASAAHGRPAQPDDIGSRIELGYAGATYVVRVDNTGPRRYSIRHDSDVADVVIDALDPFERRISCGGRRHRVLVTPLDSAYGIEVDGAAHIVTRDDGVVVSADWPALVVSALVSPGDHIRAGTPIAVLESMKMETTVMAPFDGEVVTVSIATNMQVERGAALMRVRPRTATTPVRSTAALPVDLSGLAEPIDFSRKPCLRVYEPIGNYLLGYDLAPAALKRLVTEQRRLAEIADPADEALLECENGLLDIYTDLGALYRPQTESEAEPDDMSAHAENTQEYFVAFLQWLDADRAGLPATYRERLRAALGRCGVHSLDHTPAFEAALVRLYRSFTRLSELNPMVAAVLQRRLAYHGIVPADSDARARLDRLIDASQGRQQNIADLARDVRFHYFDEPPMVAADAELRAEMADHLARLAAEPELADRAERIERLVWCPPSLRSLLVHTWYAADQSSRPGAVRSVVLEVYVRRFYRIRDVRELTVSVADGEYCATASYAVDGESIQLVVGFLPLDELPSWAGNVAATISALPVDRSLVVDVVTWRTGVRPDIATMSAEVATRAGACSFGRRLHRVDVTVVSSEGAHDGEAEHLRTQSVTFRQQDDGTLVEELLYRNLHPMLAKRLELWRLSGFELDRRPSPPDVYLFHGVARTNQSDQRLFALAEVRDLVPVHNAETGEVSYPRLERTGLLALAAIRGEVARFAARDRPVANRLVLDVRAPWTLSAEQVGAIAQRFLSLAARAGLEKVVLKVRIPDGDRPGELREAVLHISAVGRQILVHEDRAGNAPVRALTRYQQKVLTAARFGSPYPYEIVRLFTEGGALPRGSFVELDLDTDVDGGPDVLVPVDRAPGNNTAHLVVGLLTNDSNSVPEGVKRIALLSDPTQGLGNLAEPECRRINAALAYALDHTIPLEWFAVSSGALIAMDSGTENMDWIALTLRRLIEFTQAGGEVNIIVTGINVGGQPYWNAEATMLMHTKGILVMTPASAMVLTGKQALDFSGAVSAEDNFGIGGYDRVMGPNGQAQYWAPSFPDACALLMRHYELTYVVPGERFPRRRPTDDPVDRDVCTSPHAVLPGSVFASVGDVFSAALNPERKQPFDMRSVMRAVADTDSEPLERWKDLRDGDTSIVWDTTVGGIPVCMLGIESHSVVRRGFVPADGPPAWTSGTLFPQSSRKTARAVNAASARRPLVVLANLSGFDGSPESMRRRQLEFGAEIGRAVTNFDGPIVFVVVSRYHGGAFVVFSKALNESMEIAAVEGSYASVIGGAPAAATVFAREVKQRTEGDDRVKAARDAAAAATGPETATLRAALERITRTVRSEKLGEVADEFDAIHTIDRALQVGSVDRIIPADEIRPYVVDALLRGMAKF